MHRTRSAASVLPLCCLLAAAAGCAAQEPVIEDAQMTETTAPAYGAAPAGAAKPAGPAAPRIAVNADGDGHPEEEWLDTNSDGRYDEWRWDANDDGLWDGGKFDLNKDGRFDLIWNDVNGDGKKGTGESADLNPREPVVPPKGR